MEYFWSSYKSKRSSSATCFEEDKNCQHQHQNEQVIVGNIIINERENQHCHHHHHSQYHYKEEYQITLMDPRPYFMRLSLIQYQHRSLYHIHTLFLIVSFFHSIYHTRLAYTRKSTIAIGYWVKGGVRVGVKNSESCERVARLTINYYCDFFIIPNLYFSTNMDFKCRPSQEGYLHLILDPIRYAGSLNPSLIRWL